MAEASDLRATASATDRTAGAALLWASVAVLVGLTLHLVAHIQMGHYPGHVLFFGGVVGYVLSIWMVVIAARRASFAARAGIAIGFGTAIPVTIVHFVPMPNSLAFLSYNFPSMDPNGFAWFSVVATILAGLALGFVGLSDYRRRRRIPA